MVRGKLLYQSREVGRVNPGARGGNLVRPNHQASERPVGAPPDFAVERRSVKCYGGHRTYNPTLYIVMVYGFGPNLIWQRLDPSWT